MVAVIHVGALRGPKSPPPSVPYFIEIVNPKCKKQKESEGKIFPHFLSGETIKWIFMCSTFPFRKTNAAAAGLQILSEFAAFFPLPPNGGEEEYAMCFLTV